MNTDGIVAERGAVYGHPAVNHARTALLWTAWLQAAGYLRADQHLDARAVTALNRLQKESRLIQTPGHQDSLADIAGYARNDLMLTP